MQGELFGGIRVWHSPKRDAYTVLKHKYDNNPQRYLDEFAYRPGPIFIHAAGWNLQYSQRYHWKYDQGFDFIDYIKDNEVKVIHLIRRNFVDTILSNLLAIENDVWMKDGYARSVKASVEQFHRAIETYQRDVFFFKGQFPDACLVHYDRLLSSDTQRKILEFIDVPLVALRIHPNTNKQRSKSQREMLENFDEIKESFRGTKYFDQFD